METTGKTVLCIGCGAMVPDMDGPIHWAPQHGTIPRWGACVDG